MSAGSKGASISNLFIVANRNDLLNWSKHIVGLDPFCSNVLFKKQRFAVPARIIPKAKLGWWWTDIRGKVRIEKPLKVADVNFQRRMLSSGAYNGDMNSESFEETAASSAKEFSRSSSQNTDTNVLLDRLRDLIKDEKINHDCEIKDLWIQASSSIYKESPSWQRIMQIRFDVYNYLSNKEHKGEQIEKANLYILELVRTIPRNQMTRLDFELEISTLVALNKVDEIDKAFKEAHRLLDRENFLDLLYKVINDMVVFFHRRDSKQNSNPKAFLMSAFNITIQNLLRLNGYLAYTSPKSNKEERRILRLIMNACYNSHNNLENFIIPLIEKKHVFFASSILTSFMHISLFPNRRTSTSIDIANKIWELKHSYGLLNKTDLAIWMHFELCRGHPKEALARLDANPELESDSNFDTVLQCYAKLRDWNGLQECFNSLFGRGELPNLKHYQIVLRSITPLGRVSIADELFESLIHRGFIPNISIFHSVMFSRLAFGDTKGVVDYFTKMRNFDLEPTRRSYNILLLAYRDAKNLTAGLKILEEMIHMGITPRVEEFTTLLSLCSRSRDRKFADRIWRLSKNLGVKPDIIMYNSYLSSLIESNYHNEAWKQYQNFKKDGIEPRIDTVCIMFSGFARFAKMDDVSHKIQVLYQDTVKYKLRPNSYWLSHVLYYLCNARLVNEAEKVFQEMENAGIKKNSSHYNILIDGNSWAKNFDRVGELLAEMEQKNLTPTFQTHAFYLNSRRFSKNDPLTGAPNNEDINFVNDFVSSDALIDLSSSQLPRNTLPIGIVRLMVRRFIKTKHYELAHLLLEQYDRTHGKNNSRYQYFALKLELAHKSGNLAEVERYWNNFLEELSKVTVEDDGGTRTIPKRYAKDYITAISARIEQLQAQERSSDLKEFPFLLKEKGLKFGSLNYNQFVRALISFKSTILLGCELANRDLMPGYILRRVRRRLKLKGDPGYKKLRNYILPFTMSQKTMGVFVNHKTKLIDAISDPKNVISEEAQKILEKRYPRLMRGISMWEKEGMPRNFARRLRAQREALLNVRYNQGSFTELPSDEEMKKQESLSSVETQESLQEAKEIQESSQEEKKQESLQEEKTQESLQEAKEIQESSQEEKKQESLQEEKTLEFLQEEKNKEFLQQEKDKQEFLQEEKNKQEFLQEEKDKQEFLQEEKNKQEFLQEGKDKQEFL